LFAQLAAGQGKAGYLPEPTPHVMAQVERKLAGSIGAAAAHAMISQLAGQSVVTVEDLMAVAGETALAMENAARLAAREAELTIAAQALAQANDKLTQLSAQKDAFLSQISHELRTPMTSIRAFSEILTAGDVPPAMVARSGQVIQAEAARLTRLLDDLLDLSVLENGAVQLNLTLVNLSGLIDRALAAADHVRADRTLTVVRNVTSEQIFVTTDADRLVQVLINLVANARKYCDAPSPELRFVVRQRGGRMTLDVIDNGRGIPAAAQGLIFEKFARLTDETRAGGAGLGLAICREVMANLGGSIVYLPGQEGAAFRVVFPLRLARVAGVGGGVR